jgi:hypothetical protein
MLVDWRHQQVRKGRHTVLVGWYVSRALAVRLAMVVDCQRDLNCLRKNLGLAENAADWQAAALAPAILRPAALLPHQKQVSPLLLWLARNSVCDGELNSIVYGLQDELHLDVFGLACLLDALSETSAVEGAKLLTSLRRLLGQNTASDKVSRSVVGLFMVTQGPR